MDPVRIGYVRYLNTLPLVEGLRGVESIEMTPDAPSAVIDRLTGGEVDIGLVSLIDAMRSEVPLTLIPSGMIGCDGPTLTVRVFSRRPISGITTISADTESHTSVALCRLLMRRMHGLDPLFEPFDAGGHAPSENWPETVLLIGDKVVTASPSAASHPHQFDLGMAWKELTGLPFMYATWMCRAEDERSCAVRAGAALLDRTRRHNATRLGWIARTSAALHGWPEDLAARYLGEYLRYAVGPREREAAERFLREAGEIGSCRAGEVRWLDTIGAGTG